jgi:hypothetical protein
MLIEIELMEWIEHFGRWNVQELIAKRQDMSDVITYLRAERSLELAKVSAFVTSDSVRFEREEASLPAAEASVLCAEDGLRKYTHLVIEKREV